MEREGKRDWMLYREGLDFRGDLLNASHLTLHEVRGLFKSFGGRAFYIRNVYDFDCAERTGFWYVVRDRVMGVDEYPKRKDRQQIRRSLRA